MNQVLVAVVLSLVALTSAQVGDCSALNNCSGNGQCREGGVCVCHAGFGSEDCSLSTTGCVDNCFGHGTCLDGTCSCDTGFTGDSCNVVLESCPRNCSGHGMCHDGSCICFPGLWTGAACDEEIYNCPAALNDCTGNGECGPIDWQNEASEWACTCNTGFCGEKCDQVCGACLNNCTGHGICSDGVNCACHAGFMGEDCSYVAPIVGCPNNCSGNGLCQATNGTSGYRCVCDSCYTGPACQNSPAFCPGNCSHNGFCGCDGKCRCATGFEGLACEIEQETCPHLRFCSGNGKCANATCHCNPGFAGAMCGLACPTGGNGTVGCNALKGHGKCVTANAHDSYLNATAFCACKPEYTGVGCELVSTTGLMDDYINGWNPIGTVLLCLVGCVLVALGVGMAVNYSKGKKGMNAIPGIDGLRSKVKGSDYEAASHVGEGQRNASNY